MARGKYLSLDEARKYGQLGQFCKEHPSTGDEPVFDRLLGAMATRQGTPKAEDQTSSGASDEGCTETRTPRDT